VLTLAQAAGAARRLVDPVLAVVFPSSCPACGRLLARAGDGPLCAACWQTLPRWRGATCGCGLPLLSDQAACGRCRGDSEPFAAGASLGPYEGALRLVLHELKYSGRRRAARRLAALLLEDDAVRRLVATSDVLVPVPLHPRRLRQRGFNQSALLAAALGRTLARPVCADALVRRRETAPQAGLTAAERRRNVRDAFALRRRARTAGRVVTLIDDVTTTGATALACARALASGGALEVRLLTVARA
jgi:competence protein ComFC